MSLILLTCVFFLMYCVIISLITWGVWSSGKVCSDLGIYYGVAMFAGILLAFITIIALPSEGLSNNGSNVFNRQAYNCVDSSMSASRQQSMSEFIKYCTYDRGQDITTCTEKAKSLYCTPIKEVLKPEPVNIPL